MSLARIDPKARVDGGTGFAPYYSTTTTCHDSRQSSRRRLSGLQPDLLADVVNDGDHELSNVIDAQVTVDGADQHAGMARGSCVQLRTALDCDGLFLRHIDPRAPFPNCVHNAKQLHQASSSGNRARFGSFIRHMHEAYPRPRGYRTAAFSSTSATPSTRTKPRGPRFDFVLFERFRLNRTPANKGITILPDNAYNVAPSSWPRANRPGRIPGACRSGTPRGRPTDVAVAIGRAVDGGDDSMTETSRSSKIAGFRHYLTDAGSDWGIRLQCTRTLD